MILLVTGENLLTLFLGWEGVGLVSYLLVNYWYTRIAANHASLKAVLINRVGDFALSLGLLFWLISMESLSFSLSGIGHHLSQPLINLISILILIGAIAKSAQLGLHNWLTFAMEAPTPVSALLHAATMVTAGVYLILRLSYFIEWNDDILLIITWIGGFSALSGALGGFFEYDIKKIIAFSTISQLGYMFLSLGLSMNHIALWHLVNHALFKALLFFSAGSILHSSFDIQDIRRYGAFKLFLPLPYNAFLIGNLSIIAFPFFTGFYSKDLILDLVFSSSHSFIFFLIYIAAFFTSSYSLKLFIQVFLSRPNLLPISDVSFPYSFPLILLAIGALIFGDLSQLAKFYSPSLYLHPIHLPFSLDNLVYHLSTNLGLLLLFFPPLFLFVRIPVHIPFINPLVFSDWFLRALIHLFLSMSNILFRYFDRGALELSSFGLTKFFSFFSFKFDLLSSSYIIHLIFPLILLILII